MEINKELNRDEAMKAAVLYAKKFGFMSKSFFWNQICSGSDRTKYRYWANFQNSKVFLPYREIEQSSDFFYLNPRAIPKLHDTQEAVSRRSPTYFFHDDNVMRIIFELEKSNLVKQFWTEQELKSDRGLALTLLGGDYSKLPDLVFDLNISGQTFRAVAEIEISRKSNSRYLQSCYGYSAFRKVDLILFGVSQDRIKTAIKELMTNRIYQSSIKPCAYFDLKSFEQNKLEAALDVNSKSVAIGQFFKNLIAIKSNTVAEIWQNGGEVMTGEKFSAKRSA